MISAMQFEIMLIASVTAVCCALPGVFLVLRGMALMSDAISHVVLLGIVLAFFATGDLNSPWLLIAAAATGVLTVFLVEMVTGTRLVKEDAAIGLVFPALFSIAVILVSRHAGNVHIDTDAVLLGELAFAPFDRLEMAGLDFGPRALAKMAVILALNVSLLLLFYKELKVATFDPLLAVSLGFPAAAIHYGLMTMVSVTAVGAFDAVGSVLVVGLMVGPGATAYLLTHRLSRMLTLAAGIGVLAALGGYWLAHLLDASIAGSITTVLGGLFGAAHVFAPGRGMLATWRRRARQRVEFAQRMLCIHVFNHEGSPEAARENRVDHLGEHLRWKPAFIRRVVGTARRQQLVGVEDGALLLTDRGRTVARESLQFS